MSINKSIVVCLLPLLGCGCGMADRYYLCAPAGTEGTMPRYSVPSYVGKVCAQNLTGGSVGGTVIGQSFVARCAAISAVDLAVYPAHGADGWVRLALHEDVDKRPGPAIGQSWIRVEKTCAISHGSYTRFPLETIKITPGKTYWLTIVEYADRSFISGGSVSSVTNTLFANTDVYPDGGMVYGDTKGDAKFRVLETPQASPGLLPAGRLELRSLPPKNCRRAEYLQAWRKWPGAASSNRDCVRSD